MSETPAAPVRRVFVFENAEYPDPDPSLSVDEVRRSLADFFPERVTRSA